MTKKDLETAIAECERFLERARELKRFKPEPYTVGSHVFRTQPSPKLTASVRRSSMDLSRALAELRKPGGLT